MKIRECMKRNVISIPTTSTIGDAVAILVAKHIGLLPVIDESGKPVGVLGLQDLLSLALPAFVNLFKDVDFVHNFGAVETSQPAPDVSSRLVTTLMRPFTVVSEDSGLLRAYALMVKRNLHDLPVVNDDGKLTGIASRVDIGTAILSGWQTDHKSSL